MIFPIYPYVRSLGVDGRITMVTFRIQYQFRVATWNAINCSVIKSAKFARMLSYDQF